MLKSTPTLIFVKTGFDVEKFLASRQGPSRGTHFFLSEATAGFWKCKVFLQLAVLNKKIRMLTGDLLHVNDIK